MPTASPVAAIAKLSEELIDLEDKYGAHNYQPLDVVISRGSGAWMYDSNGRRYLDFLAAYSAVNQGTRSPGDPLCGDLAGAEGKLFEHTIISVLPEANSFDLLECSKPRVTF